LVVGLTVSTTGYVDSLIANWRLSLGTSTCTGPASADLGAHPIINGAFEMPVTFPGSSITSTLRGSFSADGTLLSGSFDAYSGQYTVVCGTTLSFGTGTPLSSGTWRAQRGTATCKYAGDGECDEPGGKYLLYACLKGTDPLDCNGAAGGAGAGGFGGGASGGAGVGTGGGVGGSAGM